MNNKNKFKYHVLERVLLSKCCIQKSQECGNSGDSQPQAKLKYFTLNGRHMHSQI